LTPAFVMVALVRGDFHAPKGSTFFSVAIVDANLLGVSKRSVMGKQTARVVRVGARTTRFIAERKILS
jgi:hypothetical protein